MLICVCFVFKQKTAYELRISDWSSDVCSSDLFVLIAGVVAGAILLRKDIVAFYPPANKLFMTLGLPADTLGHGLAILKPDTAQRIEGDQRVLEVSGKIENTSGDVIEIGRASGRERVGKYG